MYCKSPKTRMQQQPLESLGPPHFNRNSWSFKPYAYIRSEVLSIRELALSSASSYSLRTSLTNGTAVCRWTMQNSRWTTRWKPIAELKNLATNIEWHWSYDISWNRESLWNHYVAKLRNQYSWTEKSLWNHYVAEIWNYYFAELETITEPLCSSAM